MISLWTTLPSVELLYIPLFPSALFARALVFPLTRYFTICLPYVPVLSTYIFAWQRLPLHAKQEFKFSLGRIEPLYEPASVFILNSSIRSDLLKFDLPMFASNTYKESLTTFSFYITLNTYNTVDEKRTNSKEQSENVDTWKLIYRNLHKNWSFVALLPNALKSG